MWILSHEILKTNTYRRSGKSLKPKCKPTILMNSRLWALLFFGLFQELGQAQTLSLDLGWHNERFRTAQLQGLVDSSISMHVLPLDIERTRLMVDDSLKLPTQVGREMLQFTSFEPSKGVRMSILPLHWRHQYNMHHNYGWQNGPMVPNKGQQMYVSWGVHFRWGKLFSMQLRPEAIWAQNHNFMRPPVRHGGIDNPDRFGSKAVLELFAGQSYAKWHHGPISWGISTENFQWGPARNGSLLFSNSAPGFLHLSVHTNRPIKTKAGSFEGQFVGGRLRYSGFFPYSIDGVPAAEITSTANGTAEHSKISAISINYQPKWVPGLFIGGGFGLQSVGKQLLPGIFAVFFPGDERANNANFAAQNGLVSVKLRYLLPRVGAEFYAEVGRDDWWFDLQDLATDPFHSTVYLLGMNKVKTLSDNDHYLRFGFEFTKLMGPMTQLSRSPGRSFYTHSNGFGWTHRGQILGVGLPPGSIRHTIDASWHKGTNQIGLALERIEYAQDLYYFRMPFLLNPNIGNPLAMDYTKRFVDLVAKLKVQAGYKKLIVGTEGMIVRTYNFQWIYEFNGTPDAFRFPGHNFLSLNLHSYLYYRF